MKLSEMNEKRKDSKKDKKDNKSADINIKETLNPKWGEKYDETVNDQFKHENDDQGAESKTELTNKEKKI